MSALDFARASAAFAATAAAPASAPVDERAAAARIEAMFDQHYDAVWRTLRRLGVADAEVDDAAQRVFLVASRRLATILVGHEGRFLYGVAVRVASEVRRRSPSRREIGSEAVLVAWPDPDPSPEERVLDREALDLLDAVLGSLEAPLREILVLAEIEGQTAPEIAAIFGIPVGTATSRLRRAREAFGEAARRMRARVEGQRFEVVARSGKQRAGGER